MSARSARIISSALHLVTNTAFTAQGAVQAPATRMQRLVIVYATARPIIAAVAAIPLIPATWRAVLSVFVVTLDEVTASFKQERTSPPAPRKVAQPWRWSRSSPRDRTHQ